MLIPYKYTGKRIKHFQFIYNLQKPFVDGVGVSMEGNDGKQIIKCPLGTNGSLKVDSKDKMSHLMKNMQLFS